MKIARDKRGLSHFACAIDVGNDWRLHAQWLSWLIGECRKGTFPDIREVIGSFDGKNVVGWDAENHWMTEPDRGDSTHLWHTHISFYRDAALRDQTAVLKWFFEPPPLPKPVKSVKPVRPRVVSSTAPPAVKAAERILSAPALPPGELDVMGAPWWPPFLGLPVLGLWWLLRRRMELDCEDSE